MGLKPFEQLSLINDPNAHFWHTRTSSAYQRLRYLSQQYQAGHPPFMTGRWNSVYVKPDTQVIALL